ncbi:MAG: conjugal transfer protein [Lachnospiraceae bacterium]|nr:conjugal transfer protein [Lachnospiraceae bacterium]
MQTEWIISAPSAAEKHTIKYGKIPVLINYPLYCPKCRQETLVDAKDFQITVIQKQEH